jgi:hypothetical protein
MRYSKPTVSLAALALLLGAGCESLDPSIVAPDSGETPLAARGGTPGQPDWSPDAEFARAARAEAPGLAGYYLEGNGTPVILLKDQAHRGAAQRYLAQQIAATRKGRIADASRQPVFRTVAYDFAELKGWFDQLEGLVQREEVYTIDVDEVQNRVTVGVRDEAAIGAVRSEAARVGVPSAALYVRAEPAPKPRATVQDWVNPLVGGYQIQFNANYICSLGFTAISNNTQYVFVTNSHCTNSYFAIDGGTIMQPTWVPGNEVGTELLDRPLYRCAGLLTFCRRSDAAYIAVDSIRSVGYASGRIAQTAWNTGGPGGLTVIGNYDIVRRYAGTTPVGTWLDKTGRTSGSTYGQVTQSCVTIDLLRCQDVSSVWSEGGDSGSPMYVYLRDNQVELQGILWGGPDGNWNVTYSSRLAGIEADLGVLSGLCAPGYGC